MGTEPKLALNDSSPGDKSPVEGGSHLADALQTPPPRHSRTKQEGDHCTAALQPPCAFRVALVWTLG